MKIATTRAVIATAALLLAAGSLTACSNGSSNGSSNATASASSAKIGLLLPDSVTARYESADKPYFEAKVTALCPDCTVLYANADGDASKQQQQAESMLTQGVNVLVLDPFDGEAQRPSSAKRRPRMCRSSLTTASSTAPTRRRTSRSTTRRSASFRVRPSLTT